MDEKLEFRCALTSVFWHASDWLLLEMIEIQTSCHRKLNICMKFVQRIFTCSVVAVRLRSPCDIGTVFICDVTPVGVALGCSVSCWNRDH